MKKTTTNRTKHETTAHKNKAVANLQLKPPPVPFCVVLRVSSGVVVYKSQEIRASHIENTQRTKYIEQD
jgi:hypothetical protein